MPEPIEITEKDLIPRPETLPVQGAKAPTSWLSDIKGSLKDVQDVLNALGIDWKQLIGRNIGFGIKGEPKEPLPDARGPGGNPLEQIQVIVRLIAMQYGDITLNELLDRLKKEYGSKKLTDFLKK